MIDFAHWPPTAADLQRLQGYQIREQLWASDFKEAFRDSSAFMPPEIRERVYLSADWPKKIILDSADMLLGEFPTYSQPDQEQLKRLFSEQKLQRTLYQTCLGTSYRGDGIVSLRIRDGARGPELCIESKSACCYFVEQDPDNGREVLSEALAWMREDSCGNCILRVDHHFAGSIVREAWELSHNNLIALIPPELQKRNQRVSLRSVYGDSAPSEYEATGLERSLLFHVPNFLDDTAFFGFSDLSDSLIGLFDSYNERLTEIHRVISAHAGPKMVVPAGTLDENGQVRKRHLEMFEIPAGSDPNNPRYMTWNCQLEAAYQEAEKLENLIFKMSESYGLDFGKGPLSIDSTGAMRLLFLDPIKKATRKKLYWDPFIKDVCYWAQVFASRHGVDGYRESASAQPDLVWQDGLPHNTREQVQTESVRVQAGLTSRESAIQRIDQITQSAAVAELAKMRSENPLPVPQQV